MWRKKVKELFTTLIAVHRRPAIDIGEEGYLKIKGYQVTLYRVK